MKYSNIKRIKSTLMFLLVFFAGLLAGCEKMTISDDLAGFDPEGDLALIAVNLTGPGQASGERLMDIGEGKLYNLADGGETPEVVDFVMLWGSSSGMNFVSPIDMSRLSEWAAAGSTINENWLVKNATTFLKLKASEANHQIYESISSAADVKAAYDQALSTVNQQDGYVRNQHGPGLSIRNVNPGDIVLFKTNKDVYAIAKIMDINTGISGSTSMSVKIDLRDKKEIQPVTPSERIDMYNVTLDRPGYLGGKRYWDVSEGNTYNVSSASTYGEHAFYNQEKIDLVFFNSASNGAFNLISPHNASRLDNWNSGTEITEDWLIKNEGELIKLDASPMADSIFLYSYTKTLLHESYANVTEILTTENNPYHVDVHGPGFHVSELKEGDVIFFKSESKNILAMFQINSHTSGGSGALDIAVKVDNTEKTEVLPSPDALNYGQIKIGGWSNLGPEGNTFHVDLATITRLDPASADASQGSVDLLNLWSGAGFVNFMAPTSGAVTSWGSSSRIVDWDTRNNGTFILLSAPSPEEEAIFNGLVNRELLVQAYEDAEANVATRPNYNSDNNGPSIRIRHLAAGDIIYFKSNAPGRNLYAAIEVIEIIPGSSNGREVVEIIVKSNLLN